MANLREYSTDRNSKVLISEWTEERATGLDVLSMTTEEYDNDRKAPTGRQRECVEVWYEWEKILAVTPDMIFINRHEWCSATGSTAYARQDEDEQRKIINREAEKLGLKLKVYGCEKEWAIEFEGTIYEAEYLQDDDFGLYRDVGPFLQTATVASPEYCAELLEENQQGKGV
jgi:hypothetical protein